MKTVILTTLLLIGGALSLSAQQSLFAGAYTVNPYAWLSANLDAEGKEMLSRQPNLKFDGVWTENGPQFTSAGAYYDYAPAVTNGGFSIGNTLTSALAKIGISVQFDVRYTFTYSLNWVKVNAGTYILQLTWSKVMDNGQILGGVQSVGVVIKDHPGLWDMSKLIGSPKGIGLAPPNIVPRYGLAPV